MASKLPGKVEIDNMAKRIRDSEIPRLSTFADMVNIYIDAHIKDKLHGLRLMLWVT